MIPVKLFREAFQDFSRKIWSRANIELLKSKFDDYALLTSTSRSPAAKVSINDSLIDGSEERNLLESSLLDWMTTSGEETSVSEPEKPQIVPKIKYEKASVALSRSVIERRTKLLVSALAESTTSVSQRLRLQEVCKHISKYPETSGLMNDVGVVRCLLRLRDYSKDIIVQNTSRQALAMVGYCDPPKGRGVRILSIDGGGSRGIVVLEMLKHIESLTKQPIWKTFDLICGVSVGSMIAMLIGPFQKSLQECDEIYKKFTSDMFQRDLWGGTQRLLWTHAYYDSARWNDMLKHAYTEKTLIETAQNSGIPKTLAISAVVNTSSLQPYVFRNYHPSDNWSRDYEGSCSHKVWEAVRASSAAPGYFEEFVIGPYVHQDGGLLMNNPTAIAIHEAQLLWPNEPIQCCVSIGTGKYSPLTPFDRIAGNVSATTLRTKLLRLIDSATDTEGVHRLLQDLMQPGVYFRLNPSLSDYWNIDENRPEKLEQMKTDAQMYIRKNEYKFKEVVKSLSQRRSRLKKSVDWLQWKYSLTK
ncbi:calcium-independent phospholipase A2-gamma-like protein [Leptotrombidium deliense]|uniref:Calcium-independent phospholipase A2-gamma-like protein n=1 Tax=Leptotrombidium deliense TaxID=299467 RepID=A0A443SVH2_9ACAR|nr:calcium-independent phospholipase A2-gamma-like protein [Leptotrombidium deliense]